jgi:predicted TIM-barrel fold metal-dependent hydrolase
MTSWRWVLASLVIAASGMCFAASSTYSVEDFARVEKIDTHVHLHGELPIFMSRAEADKFRLLTINVNYGDFPAVEKQLEEAVALRRAYPGRVEFAGTFDASGSQDPAWLERAQSQVRAALKQGAIAIKVWKDIGMQYRDADGSVVMIDDTRFAPVFHELESRHVVVLGHQGEPRNAWLPLSEMTVRGDREYFEGHPQYHMFSQPQWPSYEQQIAARDRFLDRYKHLRYVGLHLASLEWNVDRIAEFLRRYPHASVDLAARMVHLELQASSDREKVRQFFVEFQDRILYATDLTRTSEQSDAEFADEAHRAWMHDWQFLTGEAEMKSSDFDAPFHGLALPRGVVDKIYRKNAQRMFPHAFK